MSETTVWVKRDENKQLGYSFGTMRSTTDQNPLEPPLRLSEENWKKYFKIQLEPGEVAELKLTKIIKK